MISSDDLRKTINPSDSDLEAFFKKNAARYAAAVPEERKITYFAFTPSQIPGGVPQPTQQEIQQYYTRTSPSTRRRSRPGRGTFSSRCAEAPTPRPMPQPKPKPRAS